MIFPLSDDKREFIIGYLADRFGVTAEAFDAYEWHISSKGRVFVTPHAAPIPQRATITGLQIARLGLLVKPATDFFQVFGAQVSRSRVALTADQTKAYVAGADLTSPDFERGGVTRGYVMLTWRDEALACGFYADGVIRNMLPKEKWLTVRYL